MAGGQLGDRVAGADHAGLDHRGVDAAQVQGVALLGVDEPQCLEPEPGHELLAPPVREVADLDHRRADRQPGAGRQVLAADVEVDVELVAGERPAVAGAGHQRCGPRVHDRDLASWITGPVEPAVADQAGVGVDLGLGEHLPLPLGWAADDQLEGALVGGGVADVVQTRFQRGVVQVHALDRGSRRPAGQKVS